MFNKLIALGFSSEQAEEAINNLGIETEQDLILLKESDLIALGFKPVPARRILAAVGAIYTNSEPREVIVRLDKVSGNDEPEELLEVIASTTRSVVDRRAAAWKLAGLGRNVVVDAKNRKEVRIDDTMTYWRVGSVDTVFWGRDDHPVVSPSALFQSNEKVEIDPYELVHGHRLVALHEGYNAETGADWANVTMFRRALLIAAALDGEQVARGDSVTIANALSVETLLSGKWRVLESRADAERLTGLQRYLRVPCIDIESPDSIGWRTIFTAIFGASNLTAPAPARETRTSVIGMEDFFLCMFGISDLEMLADHMSSGLSRYLPAGAVPPATYARDFVELMNRYGFLNNRDFWMEVFRQRGGGTHRNSILQMAERHGVNL